MIVPLSSIKDYGSEVQIEPRTTSNFTRKLCSLDNFLKKRVKYSALRSRKGLDQRITSFISFLIYCNLVDLVSAMFKGTT